MTVKIKDEFEAASLLGRAVAEKGSDYRYIQPDEVYDRSCLYFETDPETDEQVPGCIVGHVLSYLGAPPPSDELNYENSDPRSLVSKGVLEAPPIVVAMLSEAQIVQDKAGTWGEARAAANRARDYFYQGAGSALSNARA